MNDKIFSSMNENIELLGSLGEELKFQAKTTFNAQLKNLDLVSREEYETTVAVLERALERVAQLEAELVENGFGAASSSSKSAKTEI